MDDGVTTSTSSRTADTVNDNGSVVVGQLPNSQAYIARVSDIGSGLITVTDLSDSLGSTGQGVDELSRSARIMVKSAHSRPMSGRGRVDIVKRRVGLQVIGAVVIIAHEMARLA